MNLLAYHPLANLFPLIEGEEFGRLVEDVRAHGLRDLIVVHEGKILDGRNRWRAAVAAGRMKEGAGAYYSKNVLNDGFREFGSEAEDGEDPLAWVISKNLNRRHLSESQRAMVAARIANMRQGARTDLSPIGEKSQADAAMILNVGKRSVERARTVQERAAPEVVEAVDRGDIAVSAAAEIAALPADEQKRLIEAADPKVFLAVVKEQRARRQAEKKERRQHREIELGARQTALPAKKYGVIVADPEWRFKPYSSESGMDRAADNHYPTSDLETLMRRDVGAIAADDSVLFLWATVPMLVEAICAADAWGFCWFDRQNGLLVPEKGRARYVTHFAWLKQKIITGYWNRGKHEILLVFTRGNPVAPAMGDQLPSWAEGEGVAADATEHSRKPEIFLEWIERLWPNTPKIELNARRARPGWDAWGNEAPFRNGRKPANPLSWQDQGHQLVALANDVEIGAIFPPARTGEGWRWKLWRSGSACPAEGLVKKEGAARVALASRWSALVRQDIRNNAHEDAS